MRLLRSFVFLVLAVVVGATSLTSAQDRQWDDGITLFTDQNFRGKSANYRYDVPNLDPLGLNDDVSSLTVGQREVWEVCEHANYQGRCVLISGDQPNLRSNGLDDRISSFRRLRGRGRPDRPPQYDPYMVLFDRTSYRGNPTNYNTSTPDLFDNNRRARSVTIGRGKWELCEGRNFSGRCITLDRSVSDLRNYNLNRVSSVRPLDDGGYDPPSNDDWYIVLFDQTNYRGTPANYNGAESDLNIRARSVTIGGGVWELCEGRNFTGRCVTLGSSVPDMRSVFGNRVASLRPARRQPR
jgi:hypothetical protein